MSDRAAAIRRVEESKETHVAWLQHLRVCKHCKLHPPQYIQSEKEQEKIIAEYENVLTVLRGES